jgi:hypothetical protein
MRRYGFREEASDLACALMEAATRFEYSVPEVFSRFERDQISVPVPYPEALVPQAWAAELRSSGCGRFWARPGRRQAPLEAGDSGRDLREAHPPARCARGWEALRRA